MKFSVILLILIQFPLHAQCNPEYTYFDTIPASVNIIDGDSCFYTNDIDVLDTLISENGLDYDSPLELGTQTWNNGRVKILVAGNYGNDSGVNDTIFVLPDSIGNWNELSALYLEWNRIAEIPPSFSQLTNMQSLYISNNRVQNLPEDFGNLSNLYLLDAGYNELDSLPESFCNLENLNYLWLFNNEISFIPTCICSLDINWNDMDAAWYPYFAIGGNQLCDDVPECIANSEHFHTSLDQFYYSFQVCMPQDCNIELTETTQEGIIVSIDDDDWGFVEGSYEVGDSILSVFSPGEIPVSFVVLPPFPNPVLIDSVNLLFQLPEEDQVIISIVDSCLVTILSLDTLVMAGNHSLLFNVADFSEGFYRWIIQAGDSSEVRGDIKIGGSLSVFSEGPFLPTSFDLHQNYPNPFNPVTTIRYDLPMGAEVELAVYDLLGREVAMLVSVWQEAGNHQIIWDAHSYSAGIYFIQMTSGHNRQVQKLILLK